MYNQYVLSLLCAVFISLSCHAMHMDDLLGLAFSKKVTETFQRTNKRHEKVSRIKKIAPLDHMFFRLFSRQQKPLISPMPLTCEDTECSLPLAPKDDIVLPGDFSMSSVDDHTIKTLNQELKETFKEPIAACIETVHENAQRLVVIKDRVLPYLINQDKGVEDTHYIVETDIHVDPDPVIALEHHSYELQQINPDPSLPKLPTRHQLITPDCNYISKDTLIDTDPNKPAKNNSSKLNISKQKILVAAVTSASLMYLLWKQIHNEQIDDDRKKKCLARVINQLIDPSKNIPFYLLWKQIHNEQTNEQTDEELLFAFNDTFNNEEYADDRKKQCLERVINRLIDPKKTMPFELLKSMFDQYDKDPLINKGLLKRDVHDTKKPGGYSACRVIVSRALLTLDDRALKLLFSHDMYQKKSSGDLSDGFFLRNKYDIPEPMHIILHFPEGKQKEKCIKIFFKYAIYQGMFSYIFTDDCPIEYYSSDISKDERIEKYVKLCTPFITDSDVFYDFIREIKRFIDVNPNLYKELIIMLLSFGTKISKCCQIYQSEARIEEEIKFRNDFFTYNDKNHYTKYNELRERHPNTMGCWILRVLQSRLEKPLEGANNAKNGDIVIDTNDMIDMSMHDVKHIPQLCLEEMNKILSNQCAHDKETKKEIVQWRDLFLFLGSKLPDAFTSKSRELGILMRKIVEQGYYQKKSTYKALRSILEYCLESDTLCPDISVQNGVEGSMIHILSWSSFSDNDILGKTIDTYRVKDPALLYYASSCIKSDRFKHETGTTPKDIAQNRLNMCTDSQEKEKIIETIAILNQIPSFNTNNLDNIVRHIKDGHERKLNEEKLKIHQEKLEIIKPRQQLWIVRYEEPSFFLGKNK